MASWQLQVVPPGTSIVEIFMLPGVLLAVARHLPPASLKIFHSIGLLAQRSGQACEPQPGAYSISGSAARWAANKAMRISGPATNSELADVAKAFPNLEELHVRSSAAVTTHAVAQLLRLHNLHTLSIRAATNAALSQLASLPNLHTLDLNHARISDSMLHRVGALTSLRTLKLGRFRECQETVTAGFTHLESLTGLTRLEIQNGGLFNTNDCLEALSAMGLPLVHLGLRECYDVMNNGLKQLPLQRLELSGARDDYRHLAAWHVARCIVVFGLE